MKTTLTPIQKKRVAIAKDVLKHLDAQRIEADKGRYFVPETQHIYAGKQLKDVLPKIKHCKVCALGSMFYSYVSKYNNYIIPKYGVRGVNNQADKMRDLMDMFTRQQLNLIETAFERRVIEIDERSVSKTVLYRAMDFGERKGIGGWDDDRDDRTLRAIMDNVIKNKGTFRP